MNKTNAPRILVVGSINMDLVVRSSRLPIPGETLIGSSLTEIPGGKGANQAVAAARLGGRVAMIGRVGDDAFGAKLKDGLQAEGVDVSAVAVTPLCSSGVAIIGVDNSGQNCITVVPGANGRLSPSDVEAQAELFAGCDVLLVQLEVPIETVQAAVRMARQHNVRVILDPAPAVTELPPDLFFVDVLCPNETEAALLTGMPIDSAIDAISAARQLKQSGAVNVIITMGDQGIVLHDADDLVTRHPAVAVQAVDTTAAGDAFAAAVAIQLGAGESIIDATRFGSAAGAIASSRPGAQPAMPTEEEVQQLLVRP